MPLSARWHHLLFLSQRKGCSAHCCSEKWVSCTTIRSCHVLYNLEWYLSLNGSHTVSYIAAYLLLRYYGAIRQNYALDRRRRTLFFSRCEILWAAINLQSVCLIIAFPFGFLIIHSLMLSKLIRQLRDIQLFYTWWVSSSDSQMVEMFAGRFRNKLSLILGPVT